MKSYLNISRVNNGFLVEVPCNYDSTGHRQQYVYENLKNLLVGLEVLLAEDVKKGCKCHE